MKNKGSFSALNNSLLETLFHLPKVSKKTLITKHTKDIVCEALQHV